MGRPAIGDTRLRALRDALGFEAREIADAAGISRAAYSRLETGSRQLGTPETLDRLAAAFGVPMGSLYLYVTERMSLRRLLAVRAVMADSRIQHVLVAQSRAFGIPLADVRAVMAEAMTEDEFDEDDDA